MVPQAEDLNHRRSFPVEVGKKVYYIPEFVLYPGDFPKFNLCPVRGRNDRDLPVFPGVILLTPNPQENLL